MKTLLNLYDKKHSTLVNNALLIVSVYKYGQSGLTSYRKSSAYMIGQVSDKVMRCEGPGAESLRSNNKKVDLVIGKHLLFETFQPYLQLMLLVRTAERPFDSISGHHTRGTNSVDMKTSQKLLNVRMGASFAKLVLQILSSSTLPMKCE